MHCYVRLKEEEAGLSVGGKCPCREKREVKAIYKFCIQGSSWQEHATVLRVLKYLGEEEEVGVKDAGIP